MKFAVNEREAAPEAREIEGELEWEGNLLVFNGPIPPNLDIRKLIEQDREDRIRHILGDETKPP